MLIKCGVIDPIIERIQSVLCVDEDDFPTWVTVLAWQLSSDWTKTPQSVFYAIYTLLLTH